MLNSGKGCGEGYYEILGVVSGVVRGVVELGV